MYSRVLRSTANLYSNSSLYTQQKQSDSNIWEVHRIVVYNIGNFWQPIRYSGVATHSQEFAPFMLCINKRAILLYQHTDNGNYRHYLPTMEINGIIYRHTNAGNYMAYKSKFLSWICSPDTLKLFKLKFSQLSQYILCGIASHVEHRHILNRVSGKEKCRKYC